MKHKPNIKLFIDQGFIEKLDANTTPHRGQHDHPEERREEKSRVEGDDASLRSEYEFESGVIRLSRKSFDNWKSAFTYLDLRAELISLTDWAAAQPKWFPAVSGALAKRNRDEKRKREPAIRIPADTGDPVWREAHKLDGIL